MIECIVLIVLFVKSRFDSRDIWVLRDGRYVFAIRPDGSHKPIG